MLITKHQQQFGLTFKIMKKIAFTIFRIAVAIILIGKILNWFLHFGDQTNQILNILMFGLIGIAYTIAGFLWDKKLTLTKTIIICCGLFLIIMNFITEHTILTVIGIICILTPMLIARFTKDESNERKLAGN